jgi:hypothetical protein
MFSNNSSPNSAMPQTLEAILRRSPKVAHPYSNAIHSLLEGFGYASSGGHNPGEERMRRCLVGFCILGLHLSIAKGTSVDEPMLAVDDLSFLVGNWAGRLEYLDYKDNKTRRQIEASLACKADGEGFVYRFSYIEPNGSKVEGDEVKLTLADRGRQLRLNDEQWRVTSKSIDRKTGKYEFVISRQGNDDNKPAELRRTIASPEKGTLTIRTTVRPEGAKDWLVRNEYLLKKE